MAPGVSLVLRLAAPAERVTIMFRKESCNTVGTSTDARTWMVIGRPQVSRAERAPSRDDYLYDGRHEVAAMAARIAGSFAVVLTFTVGLAYLIVRVLTS